MTSSTMAIAVYEAEIQEFCQRVIENVQPDCIILHGSVARGTYTARSDVDLIVIGGRLSENFLDRLSTLSRLHDGHAPIEVIGYTLAEWQSMMRNFHLTVLEALHWGIPLYGEELFRQWQTRFEAAKAAGLQRERSSWYVPPKLREIGI
jgi:predicted nucleotidyltransferase